MARSDYAALLTEPMAEYTLCSELQRFGLDPYLPQLKKRHHTRPGKFVMRHYPLFPRYILISIKDAHHPAIRMARGIFRFRPLLADENGRPWRAPQHIIDGVRQAERLGLYDEILHKGNSVTLAYGVLATVRSVLDSNANTGTVNLLMPLFGGVRAKVDSAKMVHA